MTTAIFDFSAVFWRNWNVSDGDEMSSARRRSVALVDGKYQEHEGNIIIAIDSPPYERTKRFNEYKAHRAEKDLAAVEELKSAIETLKKRGYKIASCAGWEADDVIATLIKQGGDYTVYGIDKDLLQCCEIVDPFSGSLKTAEDALGVPPEQVARYLALVGDKSDNVPGVRGIGPTKAAKYIMEGPSSLTEKDRGRISDAAMRLKLSKELVTLNDSLELNIEQQEIEIANDDFGAETVEDDRDALLNNHVVDKITRNAIQPAAVAPEQHESAIVRRIDTSYHQALEPVGIDELWRISKGLHMSNLYSKKFGRPEAIMAAIMHGREIGIGAATSLASIHVVEGVPSLSAELMVALVKASPECEYLMFVEGDDKHATWECKRRGYPAPTRHTFTIEDADRMRIKGNFGYKTQPATMLRWRAAAALCRMEFPDVTKGLKATEEME